MLLPPRVAPIATGWSNTCRAGFKPAWKTAPSHGARKLPLVCHYHFLAAVGKKLLEVEYSALRSELRRSKVHPPGRHARLR